MAIAHGRTQRLQFFAADLVGRPILGMIGALMTSVVAARGSARTEGMHMTEQVVAVLHAHTGHDFRAGPNDPKFLARSFANIKPRRWDDACHLYYALVAIDRATRPQRPDPRLAELRDALRFPPEADGVKYNCPSGFDPDRLDFRSLFRDRAR